MTGKSFVKLFVSIFVCQLAGFIGSLFTTPKISTWYYLLNKPGWNPPNSWFAPVWTLLFILMGVALYYIWEELSAQRPRAKIALVFFFSQLAANILWSVLFFGLKNPVLGFIWIIILWLLIVTTIVKFWPVKKLAALILLPYLVWVSFAAVLNFFIWRLN